MRPRMDMTIEADPLETALRGELRRGERVLWQGRQLRRFNCASFAIFLFAIPWTAFALFWTAMAWWGTSRVDGGAGGLFSYIFPLFGLPFIAVGLAMLASPFIAWFASGRTLFAATDQRLVSISLAGRTRTRSVEGANIATYERSETANGQGTLKVSLASPEQGRKGLMGTSFQIGEVEQVRLAESAVRQLAERTRRSAKAVSSSASNPI